MPLETRIFEPEWLDELPAGDPRAIRSRRDLRRVNRWMMQGRLLAGLLLRHAGRSPPRTLLELGAGDGTSTLAVAQRLSPRWPGVTVRLLDRQSLVTPETLAGFERLGWRAEPVAMDVFDLEADAGADLILASLFLHHFTDDQLRHLFARLAPLAPVLVACETRRTWFPLLASHCLGVIGANDVTRHDGVLSVRAGFRARELSALWPDPAGWHLEEGPAGPFSHAFAARRGASA